MYQLKRNVITGDMNVVLKIEKGLIVSIPFVNDNTDYQAFLKYKEEGGKVYGPDEEVPIKSNTPEPADE